MNVYSDNRSYMIIRSHNYPIRYVLCRDIKEVITIAKPSDKF